MSDVGVLTRHLAKIARIHGNAECVRCPDEQADLAFTVCVEGGGTSTVECCRHCAKSFLDLLLDKSQVRAK